MRSTCGPPGETGQLSVWLGGWAWCCITQNVGILEDTHTSTQSFLTCVEELHGKLPPHVCKPIVCCARHVEAGDGFTPDLIFQELFWHPVHPTQLRHANHKWTTGDWRFHQSECSHTYVSFSNIPLSSSWQSVVSVQVPPHTYNMPKSPSNYTPKTH